MDCGPCRLPDSGSLFEDQLAALRERIERQRAALQMHYPDDDDLA